MSKARNLTSDRSILVGMLLILIVLSAFALSACGATSPDVEPTDEPTTEEFTFENEESRQAFAYFNELLKIPRGSHNEQAVSDFLVSFGKDLGLEVVQDESLNVVIRKPGSEGREDEEPIILQAHMDMVCEKNEDVVHDFLVDPIIPIIEGGWITADGTTLGADNGAGLSVIMAALASDTLSHPPIEALFTTNEEDGMDGAAHFDAANLKGRRLINMDSETEGTFCISSASAIRVTAVVPIVKEAAPAGLATYKLDVKGLLGGHSGVDINRGRANANIVLARVLYALGDINLVSFEGGSAENAIPRESHATVMFSEVDRSAFEEAIDQQVSELKAAYPDDAGLQVTLTPTDAADQAMSSELSSRIINAIADMPNGMYTMSPSIADLVQTSSNLGVIEMDGDEITLVMKLRSSSDEDGEALKDLIVAHAQSDGAKTEVEYQYPSWEFREVSPLRDHIQEVYLDLYGTESKTEAVHAGLETAFFAQKMPDADLISIGMDVFDVHTPDERMDLSSYDRTGAFLFRILETM